VEELGSDWEDDGVSGGVLRKIGVRGGLTLELEFW
jgi:hypothetical protein